ncbi:MAG: hypothetical protein JXM70_22895 [Pirellulales bacterium]|nr:hypothetical protein [Pirellulales bacterium]
MKRRLMLRIVAPTLVVSFILLLLGGLAAWYLHQLQRESTRLMTASLAKVQVADEIQLFCLRLQNKLAIDHLLNQETQRSDLEESHKEIDKCIEQARSLVTDAKETELLDQISQGYEHFFSVYSISFDKTHADEKHEEVLQAIRDVSNKQILEPAIVYRKLNERMATAASEREQAIADHMGVGLLLLGMCGAVAGLLAGYGIARGVRRSLVQMSLPIRDTTGALNQVIGPISISAEQDFEELESSLHDISERVSAMVNQFEVAQVAASRTQKLAAMGQMAAGLAHELRNPLTSMKILVQGAAERGDSATLDHEDLGVLREEIDRLDRIIQNYLDYARPPKLERSEFAIRRILEQTVELVESRAAQLDLRIDCQLPERIVEIDADVGQIRQVLLNLLLNAIDASPEGDTIKLTMRFEPDSPPEGKSTEGDVQPQWVIIEVADRGPGLPGDLGDRIFEPFVSSKESGTGLGLSTCKRIIEDHNGQITAQNRANGGAVFTIRLPVRAEDENDTASEKAESLGPND